MSAAVDDTPGIAGFLAKHPGMAELRAEARGHIAAYDDAYLATTSGGVCYAGELWYRTPDRRCGFTVWDPWTQRTRACSGSTYGLSGYSYGDLDVCHRHQHRLQAWLATTIQQADARDLGDLVADVVWRIKEMRDTYPHIHAGLMHDLGISAEQLLLTYWADANGDDL